jgi:hypothetical protein
VSKELDGGHPGGRLRRPQPKLGQSFLQQGTDVGLHFALERPRQDRDGAGITRVTELERGRFPYVRLGAEDLEALEDTLHHAEERLVERHRLLTRLDGQGRPLRIDGRAAADIVSASIVAEHQQPIRTPIEGAILERAQQRFHRRIAELAQGQDGLALLAGIGQAQGQPVEIGRRSRGSLHHPGSEK